MGTQLPPPKKKGGRGTAALTFQPMSIVAKRSAISAAAEFLLVNGEWNKSRAAYFVHPDPPPGALPLDHAGGPTTRTSFHAAISGSAPALYRVPSVVFVSLLVEKR